MYSQKTAKNGKVMYFKKEGTRFKIIGKADIPESAAIMDRDFEMPQENPRPVQQKTQAEFLAERLGGSDVFIETVDAAPHRPARVEVQPRPPVQQTPQATPRAKTPDTVAPEPKLCAVCGEQGAFVKMLNGQTIKLCDDHYYNMSTGRIVAAIREREATDEKHR